MAKYAFPAMFTQEDAGYSVNFPDVMNCYTSGETIAEAIEMAEDVLALMLYELEKHGEAMPSVSNLKSLTPQDNEFVSMVACDTLEYRKMYDNKAVKKTLTIPSWLNEMAEQANVNFSSTLQTALRDQLNI